MLKNISDFISKNKYLILTFFGLNIFVLVLGAYLMNSENMHQANQFMEPVHSFADVTWKVRIAVELIVLINWKLSVMTLKRVFDMKNRSTFYLYRCKKIYLYFVLFDISVCLLIFFGGAE